MHISFSLSTGPSNGSDAGGTATAVGSDIRLAAHNTVRNYGRRDPGGTPKLAKSIGMNPNTLLHKTSLDPSSNHILGVVESVPLQLFANDFSILHACAHQLGHVAIRATPDQAEGNPVETIMRMQVAQADFLRAVSEAVLSGDGAVTRNQVRRADAMAQELFATIGYALGMLRGRMRAAPESAAS